MSKRLYWTTILRCVKSQKRAHLVIGHVKLESTLLPVNLRQLNLPSPAVFTPQEVFLILISFIGWVDPRAMVRPEGLRQWKIPMTPASIEPSTCRLVERCLNRLRHRSRYLRINPKSKSVQLSETKPVTHGYKSINFPLCLHYSETCRSSLSSHSDIHRQRSILKSRIFWNAVASFPPPPNSFDALKEHRHLHAYSADKCSSLLPNSPLVSFVLSCKV